MAVDPNALTTLANVRSHLNIAVADISQDPTLERMINAASEKIEQYLDRRILKRSWTEYQDGRGNDRIVLRHWPCDKPSELWSNTSSDFTDPSDQLEVDYYDTEGDPAIGVVLLGGRKFSKGNRSIKIVYDAGYDSIPYDLEEACILTVEFMYDMRSNRRVGTKSKGKNNETTSYSGNLPQFAMDMIEPYRRVEFGLAPISVQSN